MEHKSLNYRIKALVLYFFLFLATASKSAFAFDLTLIEPVELVQNKGQWVILDARPKSDWLAGHIPGALSFSWENYTRTDEKGRAYRLEPPEQLAASLGQMGIDENTPVVVYGDADRSMGGEGWITWLILWLGHEGPIRVVDGGIRSWKDHGYTVAAGPESATRADAIYRVRLRPQINVETRELESKERPFILIDSRSELEWIMGRIPGAVHIPWTQFHTDKERRPLDRAGLEKLLKSHGIDSEKPVVFYCTGGVRSGYAWMVYQLDGLYRARNYLGGFEDWRLRAAEARHGSRSVEIPAAPQP
jgi:thiosulfate/3-mercaptopyruvate sulfurtransferase